MTHTHLTAPTCSQRRMASATRTGVSGKRPECRSYSGSTFAVAWIIGIPPSLTDSDETDQ